MSKTDAFALVAIGCGVLFMGMLWQLHKLTRLVDDWDAPLVTWDPPTDLGLLEDLEVAELEFIYEMPAYGEEVA